MAKCQDAGQNKPGCLEEADPEYDMDFSDIGEKTIHWCVPCGIAARRIDAYFRAAALSRPGFLVEFEKELDKVLPN